MTETPNNITTLAENEIFVFGSNLAGNHGRGAALTARRKFGARSGQGDGPQGRSYGIPTKDRNLRVLPLGAIGVSVSRFLRYAKRHSGLTFLVTEIGCGLAGYSPKDIAPFFNGAPANVVLPGRFIKELNGMV